MPMTSIPASIPPLFDRLDAEAFGFHAKAFTAPSTSPDRVAADAATPEGLHFYPGMRGADGRSLHTIQDFLRDPLFESAQQEFLVRLDELDSLARTHGGRAATEIRERLGRFRQDLTRDAGQYLSAALPVIYGSGKRGLDEFCAMLRHPDIDADVRHAALEELSVELRRCGPSIGVGLSRAPAMLKAAQGGLPAAVWEATDRVIEQSLQLAWRRDCDHRGKSTNWRDGMEPHALLCLRQELGLPGAEQVDAMAESSKLVNSALLQDCRNALLRGVDPVRIAGLLASDAFQALQVDLRQSFGPDISVVDPMNGDHLGVVNRSLETLRARFGDIRVDSVVEFRDPDSTTAAIVTTPSLIAMDLLRDMDRQGLATMPATCDICHWPSPPGVSSLSHVGSQVFFIEHRVPGRPEPERTPVKIADLERVPAGDTAQAFQTRSVGPWRQHLAASVLEAASDAELIDFPAAWLTDVALAKQLLSRLGTGRQDEWLERTTLPDEVRTIVDSAATELAEEREQKTVGPMRRRFTLAIEHGAAGLLATAVAELQGRAIHPRHLDDALRQRLGYPERPPMSFALAGGNAASMTVLIDAADSLYRRGALSAQAHFQLLEEALDPYAFDRPSNPSLEIWLKALAAPQFSDLVKASLPQLLTPYSRMGAPIDLWIHDPGKSERLDRWVQLIVLAHKQGVIKDNQAFATLMPAGRLAMSLLAQHNQQSFNGLLNGLTEAGRQGVLTHEQLVQILQTRDSSGTSLLKTAINSLDRDAAVGSFMSAALVALQRRALTSAEFLQLVQGDDPANSVLQALRESRDTRALETYLRKLLTATVSHVISDDQFIQAVMPKDGPGNRLIGKGSPQGLQQIKDILLEAVDVKALTSDQVKAHIGKLDRILASFKQTAQVSAAEAPGIMTRLRQKLRH